MKISTERWKLRPWRPCIEDTEAFIEVWTACLPIPLPGAADLLKKYPIRVEGVENGSLLAVRDERAIGFTSMIRAEKSAQIHALLGVHPLAQHRGLGRELLERSLDIARDYGAEEFCVAYYRSDTRAGIFAQNAGFEDRDQIHSSVYLCSLSIPVWAQAKLRAVEDAGIRIVSGTQFQEECSDWDRQWWNHEMRAIEDIPSEIPLEGLPFPKWRRQIEPPFCFLDNVRVAVEGQNLVGLTRLGVRHGDRVNINHLGVDRAYRRRGIATALKCACVAHARAVGATELTTQNHDGNPMYGLNRAFGFRTIDTQIVCAIRL